MTDGGSPREPNTRLWILIGLFAASLSPLLLLNLDEASQLASALALPLGVLLAAIAVFPPIDRAIPAIPRRAFVIAAIVAGVVGVSGVGYAIWQNTKDLSISVSAGKTDDRHYTFDVPGHPPERGFLTIVPSLHNTKETGDCEQTATIELRPTLDNHPKDPVTVRPGQRADLPLAGTARDAKIEITVHYPPGLEACAVDLSIDKAVLHD
jgi:hypothetical protein